MKNVSPISYHQAPLRKMENAPKDTKMTLNVTRSKVHVHPIYTTGTHESQISFCFPDKRGFLFLHRVQW